MLAELTPTEQIKQIFSSVLPKGGETLVRRVEARFLPLLAPGRGIAAPTEFQDLATVVTPDPKKRLRELPGPKVLHWWVTRYCPRKCVYCYAEPLHGGSADDAAIARSELARIFAEAATLGAEHLVIAGAEPLLRSDLPEVMGDAIKHGLTPFLTTKHPISQQLALHPFRLTGRHGQLRRKKNHEKLCRSRQPPSALASCDLHISHRLPDRIIDPDISSMNAYRLGAAAAAAKSAAPTSMPKKLLLVVLAGVQVWRDFVGLFCPAAFRVSVFCGVIHFAALIGFHSHMYSAVAPLVSSLAINLPLVPTAAEGIATTFTAPCPRKVLS
jgi:hypothetical protein